MKALHFGAGKIGRGFIGYILSKSGYDLTFTDISEKLVDNINKFGKYNVVSLGSSETKTETVNNVKAIAMNDEVSLENAVCSADLITLSIGANNLKDTGKVLRKMLIKRQHSGNENPLDIIACENALFATDILKESIVTGADEDFLKYLQCKVGFPNCAVDRIAPNVSLESESPIDAAVEDYYEWDVENDKIKTNKNIAGVRYVKNLAPYLERKIFLLNGAHALISYFGYKKKYKYVHEAIMDTEILAKVKTFHKEVSTALSKEYDMPENDLAEYSAKLIKRFQNHCLKDELTRVGRDPVRKLSNNDRLVAPLKLCVKHKVVYNSIIFAIAAGFAFDYKNDAKAMEIQNSIASAGIEKTISKITGLDENSDLTKQIALKYNEFKHIQ